MNSNIFPFKYIYENALFVHSKLFCKRVKIAVSRFWS